VLVAISFIQKVELKDRTLGIDDSQLQTVVRMAISKEIHLGVILRNYLLSVRYRHSSSSLLMSVINFDRYGFSLKPIPRQWIRPGGSCVSKFDFQIGFIPCLSFLTRGLS
jgi:hypothetical protein